jgi:hypothetical protein
MDHFREIKNCLTWHNEGKFEVELVNGTITKLNFCEPGKGPEDAGKSLTSTDFKYLQSVYNCLGDLFVFIKEENKRLGYQYSNEHPDEFERRENGFSREDIFEDKLLEEADNENVRPLNPTKKTAVNSAMEEERLRDIG